MMPNGALDNPVVSNAIVNGSEGNIPEAARRLDNNNWVLGLRTYATVAQQQACGWYLVVDVVKPADTPTHTYDRTLTLPAGIPTVTWVQRAKSAQEIANATADANTAVLAANPQTEIIDVLLAAIAALQVVRDTANATINGAPASYIKDVAQQQQVIARRCLRVARTVYGVLDSTAGI